MAVNDFASEDFKSEMPDEPAVFIKQIKFINGRRDFLLVTHKEKSAKIPPCVLKRPGKIFPVIL